MRLPFVSRKRYERLLEENENFRGEINDLLHSIQRMAGEHKELEKKYSALNIRAKKDLEGYDEAQRLRDAYKNRIDELLEEQKEWKDEKEHFNRRIAAYKFQGSRRKEKIDELIKIQKNSIKSLKELDSMNRNLIERNRKIEKENLEYQDYVKQLSNKLNAIKNKPTVEELKYENCLVEHSKLAGRRKNNERK